MARWYRRAVNAPRPEHTEDAPVSVSHWRWHGDALAALALVLATLALHARCLSLGFISDDFDLIGAVERPGFSLWSAFPAGSGTYFRPFVMATLAAERRVGGPGALIHHASNLGVHVLVVLLVFAICRAAGGARLLSFALALFYAVHPVNVTDVFWISGRTDLLCTVGYLSAIFGIVRLVNFGERWAALLVFVGLAVALLSKELAITLPFEAAALALLVAWRSPTAQARAELRRAQVASASMLVIAATLLAYSQVRFGNASAWATHVGLRSVARSVGGYGALIAAPVPEYVLMGFSRRHPALVGSLVIALMISAVAGLSLLAKYRGRKALRAPVLAALAIAIPLAPLASSLAPTSARLVYLPFAAACVTLGIVVPKRATKYVSAGLLVGCAVFAARSASAGAEWTRNTQASARYCDSFRSIVRTVPKGAPIVILTHPGIIGDAPVFSNDLNAALHYCVTGDFGEIQNFHWYGQIAAATPDATRDERRIDDPATRTFERRLDAPYARFEGIDGAAEDVAIDDGLARVAITHVDREGRVRGLRIVLQEKSALVLDAEDGGFVEIGTEQ